MAGDPKDVQRKPWEAYGLTEAEAKMSEFEALQKYSELADELSEIEAREFSHGRQYQECEEWEAKYDESRKLVNRWVFCWTLRLSDSIELLKQAAESLDISSDATRGDLASQRRNLSARINRTLELFHRRPWEKD
jgi:hypothetical protein